MKSPSPRLPLVACALGLVAQFSHAATPQFRVSAAGGTHTSLQKAVDACPPTGCTILLTDPGYSFSQPVSIRGKADLEIRGATASGEPPMLKLESSSFELAAFPSEMDSPNGTFPVRWQRVKSPDSLKNADGSVTFRNLSVGRGTRGQLARFLLASGLDAQGNPDPLRPAGWMAKDHLHPALFQVDSSRRIRIRDLDFQGGMPIEYVLWNLYGSEAFPLSQYSGVAAISLNRSLQATIESCHFSGWAIAIRSVGFNPGGLVSDLIQAENSVFSNQTLPLSNPGAVGGHRIEGNLATGNVLFLHMESEWDLASSIRFNRVWENGRSRLVVGDWKSSIDDLEWRNAPGGFARLKDVLYPVNLFQGNTLVRNSVDLGTHLWRASNSQLFLDNLSMRQDSLDVAHELSLKLGPNARNNWIATSAIASANPVVEDSVIPLAKDTDPLVPAWGAWVLARKLIGKGYLGDDLGAIWQAGRTPERIHLQDQTLGYVTRGSNSWKVLLPVVVEAEPGLGRLVPLAAKAQKSGLAEDPISGISTKHPLVDIDLGNAELVAGVNLLSFEIPASAADSIWHFEMALSGTDANTGRKVHSNLGTWLVRPLGKQLQVETDTLEVDPGAEVSFQIKVRDSLGQKSTLASAPVLAAEGWTIAQSPEVSSEEGEFVVKATAPAAEKVSQVVFWGSEKGRSQAVAGAAYVKVGRAGLQSIARRGAARWSIAGVRSWRGGLLRVDLAGAVGTEDLRAQLVDPAGRRRELSVERDERGAFVAIPRDRGAKFLRLGNRSVPLAILE